LARYFGVVTPLQKQFYDLLFAWTQPNGLFLHPFPLSFWPPRPALAHKSSVAVSFPESIASAMPH
jgi:hypothetical protein